MTTKSTLFANKALKLLAAIVLTAGLIGGGYLAYSLITTSQTTTVEETLLQTAKATTGDLVLYANGTGTIVPAEESSLGFRTSGQVSEIYVKLGDQVEAGDVLAQLGDTDAQIQLAEAQEAMNALTSAAALATAKQTLAEAQESFDLAKETLEFLISPEVLYWEEKVAEREQILADVQAKAQTDTSDEAKQKVAEAPVRISEKAKMTPPKRMIARRFQMSPKTNRNGSMMLPRIPGSESARPI